MPEAVNEHIIQNQLPVHQELVIDYSEEELMCHKHHAFSSLRCHVFKLNRVLAVSIKLFKFCEDCRFLCLGNLTMPICLVPIDEDRMIGRIGKIQGERMVKTPAKNANKTSSTIFQFYYI